MKIVIQPQPDLFPESKLTSFFNIPPRDPEGIKKASNLIGDEKYPRQELSKILSGYNYNIGNDDLASANIQKLTETNSRCVITGQQLGFMGGPSYTILKAISCLLLAREANSIPIFWLASEDHDIGEIDHTYLLDNNGNLERHHLDFPKNGGAVEDLELLPAHDEVISRFIEKVHGFHHFPTFPEGPVSYSNWMAQLLAKMFAGTGLVFVEPYLLRHLAVAFFKKEIQENSSILSLLRHAAEKMEQSGIPTPLEINEGTNLFVKDDDNKRKKLVSKDGDFFIGKRPISEKELLAILDSDPERFSTNVAARPILQSYLFPTLAYIAGPSELGYFQQLKDYHSYHGINMPWITPRISATIIPKQAQEFMEVGSVSPWNPLPSHTQLAAKDIHYLNNLLHPRGKLQERVLNWWEFQGKTKKNLIQDFLSSANWKSSGHLYCFMD